MESVEWEEKDGEFGKEKKNRRMESKSPKKTKLNGFFMEPKMGVQTNINFFQCRLFV